MPRGLTIADIGVTEEMIDAFGAAVWELSNNVQVRQGDPVRQLDFTAIEAQRPGTGMTDAQIADRLNLTREQVLLIRVLLEARRFDRRPYRRLYELGGSRRFRPET